MADRIITYALEGNLKEVKQDLKEVNAEVEKTNKATRKSATRTGSRAADAALSTSDIGLQRGTTGAGGRGGERDFARQAQGLGGLVHLYATFAANIYAVSAAFTALQKAADFERMEKSATRMSVVMGLNLNSIAKSMVNLTDGAMSFADSIEKVNLAGSAGLTTKQITSLTKVAKGASAALGRDMGDSMNRLFKGAIKLEPELLDELGILTKAGDAYKVYAAEIGKTEDELTKFEKTQAFTNAIIAEGNAKFASLFDTIEANPYTKLEANLRNIATTSLTIINTGLKPLIEFLSANPTALIAAVSLLVSKLINMAIPSMGEFGEKARLNAELARKSFENLNAKLSTYTQAMVAGQKAQLEANANAAKEANRIYDYETKKVLSLNQQLSQSFAETNKKAQKPILQNIFGGNYVEDVQKAIDKFSRSLDSAERMNRRLSASGTAEIKATAEARIQAISALRTEIRSADFVNVAKEYNDNLKAGATLLEDIAKLERESGVLIDAKAKKRIQEKIKIQEVKAESVLAARMAVDVGAKWSDVRKLMASGWGVVSKELVESGVTGFKLLLEKAKFYGTETGIAFGSKLMKGIGKGLNLLMIISVIKDVFIGGIASILGEAKNLDQLNTSLESSKDSHKLLTERVKELDKLFFQGQTTIQSYARAMQLAGNTLSETAVNFDDIYINFRKVQLEMQTGANWTKWIDNIKSMWGGDEASKSADALLNNIQSTITLSQKLGKQDIFKKKLADALKIDVKDVDNIKSLREALLRVIESGDYLAKEKARKAIDAMGNSAQNSSSRVTELAESLKVANDEAAIIGAKTEFKNPKYEALYNFIGKTLKLAQTDAEEANRLFGQMFADMSPELIKELSKADSSLKTFFASDIFMQNKFASIFNMSEATKNVQDGIIAIGTLLDTFFANPRVLTVVTDYTDGGEGLKLDANETKKVYTQFKGFKNVIEKELSQPVSEEFFKGLSSNARAQAEKAIEINKKQIRNSLDLIEVAAKNLEENASRGVAIDPTVLAQNRLIIDRETKKLAQARGNISNFADDKGTKATQEALKNIRKSESDGLSFPKDRLRAEKAIVETMKYELGLIEKRNELNNEDLRLADEILGASGEYYNTLLDQKYALSAQAEGQKYINSLAEAELKKNEAILSILNDKNTLNKDASIATVTSEYNNQVKLLEEGWKSTLKKLEVEKQILDIKKEQRAIELQSAYVGLAQAGRNLSLNVALYKDAAIYAKSEVDSLNAQLKAQQNIIKIEAEAAKKAGLSEDQSISLVNAKRQELELINKIYDAQKALYIENLKSFELANGSKNIGSYLGSMALDFGNQLREALRAAEPAARTLTAGIIKGIDASIDELFKSIQEGNVSMQNLADFARTQLSNAFRDAAAQSIKNVWKSALSSVFPALNDPLKLAMDQNTIAIQQNTSAITGKPQAGVPTNNIGGTTGTNVGDSAIEKASDTSLEAGKTQADAAQQSTAAAKTTAKTGETFLKASDTIFLAGATMLAFTGQWKQAALMLVAQLATTLATYAATGGSSGMGVFGTIFSGIASAFGPSGSTPTGMAGPVTSPDSSIFQGGQQYSILTKSANGNVMSPYGPVSLAKYSRGGIATTPQLSLFGEGDRNEAYVPLPDNRSIPVTLSGNSGASIGDTNISVNIMSDGSAKVDTNAAGDFGKNLGTQIRNLVHKEMMDQMRPGGILNR